MTMIIKIAFVFILTLYLYSTAGAQETLPSPTRTPDEDFVCGLVKPEIVKFNVTVWNKKNREFVRNLKYTDFEIIEDNEAYEVVFFQRPNQNAFADEQTNGYVIGFALVDSKLNKWHDVKIRVKSPNEKRNFVIKASPNRYYF